MKKLIDLTLSIIGLFVLTPFLIIIIFVIYFKIGRPIFFIQERPGLNGEKFQFYKFRTMNNNTDRNGNLLPDGERMTSFGMFLRKTSLDEIPSLINVVLGDMSLVGPRPLLSEYLGLYSDYQMTRHKVKPGITGWAQINGRNSITWEQKFDLDIWYVKNQSTFLDLKIIFKTIIKVLKQDDISHNESYSMPKFRGNIKP